MRIVDAQIHAWGSGLPSNPSHWQITSFTPGEALAMMDEAGVDAAVIQPPSWDANSLQMALQAVRDHPGRFAVMGTLPEDDPGTPARIATWRDQPGMLGLRYLLLGDAMRRKVVDGVFEPIWAAAAAARVPVAVLATDVLDLLGPIAERHPGLSLTIDHLGGRGGTSPLKDDAAMVHMPALLALARHPNIAVKVTGAPGYSTQSYPFRNMHGYIRQIYDAFGPERMLWGTDISKMPCSWRECVTMFTEELPWLSATDKTQIMGAALCRLWRWN